MALGIRRRSLLVAILLTALPALAHAGRAYVSNEDGQSVSVLDTDKAEVIATSQVGRRPRDMKFRGGTVAFIDVDGHDLITEVEVRTRPWGLALSDDGRFLFSANGPSNDVSIVDVDTMSVVKRVPVGKTPWGVVVGPTPPQS